MSKAKVLLIVPSPRQMQLIAPIVASFYSVFRTNDIDMKFFDTTFYDVSDTYLNPDKKMAEIGSVKDFTNTLTPLSISPAKNHEELLVEWRDTVNNYGPDVIFASCVESTVSFTRELLAHIRDLNLPHVLGGVFATFAPKKALNYPEIDVICVGEGENVIVDLVERIKGRRDLSDLPNIWYKGADGEIVKKRIAPAVDLDKLPSFTIEPYEESRFYRAMGGEIYRMFPVETHRGCPLVCTFCNSPLQNSTYKKDTGHTYFRSRSIDKVMEDVHYFIVECKAEYLFFWADHFLAYSTKEIEEFCERYREYKTPFYAQTYPVAINEKKIEMLVEAGLHRIGLGIEHGNEEFRKKIIRRSYSNDKAVEKVSVLKKYNIQYSCNNIVGFPTETPELHLDTVMLNRRLKPSSCSAAIFTPFEGTPLRKLALEKGYLKDPDALAPSNFDYSILEMPEFPPDIIAGKSRTFNLYVHLPENRWKEIEHAEKFTPTGDRIFKELKMEVDELQANLDG